MSSYENRKNSCEGYLGRHGYKRELQGPGHPFGTNHSRRARIAPHPISTMFRTLFFSLLLACAVAIPASSPEPEMDPMGPAMYVVPAGRLKYRSRVAPRMISNGMKICPNDYKRGFSILCDLEAKKVRFFVNGKLLMTERKAPFYIRGNFRKVVVPWKSYPASAVIKCKATSRNYIERSVQFAC